MSIQTVEIALPTGIDSVSVGLAEPISIVEVRQGAGGEPGAVGPAGAAGPNTLTTATTTNLTGFISGNGTNIAGATAATSTATANTLVLRSAGGGASFAGLNTNSGSYAQIGGATFNVATTSNANLTTTGNGTVTVSGAGGTTIGGGTLTFSPSGFAYGTGAASAHRTALGLGTGDSVTFASVGTEITTAGASAVLLQTNTSIRWLGGGQQWIRGFSGRILFGSGASGLGTEWGRWSGTSFRVGGSLGLGGAGDIGEVSLRSGGDNIIEQRKDTAAQESRIYGTYTGPGNYRRLALKMSSAGVAQIVAEGGGSGASGNVLQLPSNTTFADAAATRTALGVARTRITQDSDFSSSSSTFADTDLTVSLTGGVDYLIRGVFDLVPGSSTSGIKLQLSTSQDIDCVQASGCVLGAITTTGSSTAVQLLTIRRSDFFSYTGAALYRRVQIEVIVKLTATGNFKIRFAQVATEATASLLKAGSFLTVETL